jgi:hypothetical protein
MGVIIKERDFYSEKQEGLMKPIIYCASIDKVEKKAVSINVNLAEKLMKFQPNRRTMQLEQCFNQVLNTLPDEVTIKDFDVMFNPKYQVDIIKIMITTYRKKPFSIIWPGKFVDGKLVYAEEGYSDYKVFNVENYDVTCIV